MVVLVLKPCEEMYSEVPLWITGVHPPREKVVADEKIQQKVHEGHSRVVSQMEAGAEQCYY